MMSDYHWSATQQRVFLEALAETGSVAQACAGADKSRRAAYNLRTRTEGAAFRLGWDAAVIIARRVVADLLMDRALNGIVIETIRDPETHTTRRTHYDQRLGTALLARLDRAVENGDSDEAQAARLIEMNFDRFLDLIEGGGTGPAATAFLDELHQREEDQYLCELTEISADFLTGLEAEDEEDFEEEEEVESDMNLPAYRRSPNSYYSRRTSP